MSNQTLPLPRPVDVINAGLGRRRGAERRFRLYGVAAITLALIFLALLFISIIGKGYTAFWQTQIQIEATFAPELLDIADPTDRNQVMAANYGAVMKAALRQAFPEVSGRAEQRQLFALVSNGAEDILRQRLLDDPSLLNQTVSLWVPAGGDIDMVQKGHIDRSLPESERRVSDQELAWMDALVQQGRIEQRFNWRFLSTGDSRSPELAGIWGAVVGSFLTLAVTMLLSFPLGVAAAVYLEEFAPKNRWTDFVEVNINNLAAVPSIVFGLLGLAVFHQPLWIAAVGAPGGRAGADPDDLADHHHRGPGGAEIGAAVDPGSGAWRGRFALADSDQSCVAAGHAGHPDGHDHRHGTGTGGDRPLADDRHGGLHRRCAQGHLRSGHRPAGTNFPMGRQP